MINPRANFANQVCHAHRFNSLLWAYLNGPSTGADAYPIGSYGCEPLDF